MHFLRGKTSLLASNWTPHLLCVSRLTPLRRVIMAKWIIEPFVGIGPLKFGMSRDLDRAELGPDYQVFKKTPDSLNDSDAYDRISVHCYYDVQDRLDFIEIAYDSILSIEFKGVNFFDVTVPILLDHMKTAGHLGTISHDVCYFEDTGIAIYSPQSV